jgi:hypothetical protein
MARVIETTPPLLALYCLRGDVDYRARLLAGCEQCLGEGNRGKAACLEVDVEHIVPIALAHVEQFHARIDAGVVDQDLGRAKLIDRVGHHPFDLDEPRDIRADEMDAATCLLDAACHCLGGRLVVEPGECNVGTCLGERECDGSADALLRTGDQRDLACQFHASTPSMKVIGE